MYCNNNEAEPASSVRGFRIISFPNQLGGAGKVITAPLVVQLIFHPHQFGGAIRQFLFEIVAF